MNQSELRQELDRLCELPHETEWIEFKEAQNQYDFDKLGKYFSALSNEANLKQQACGWLVFGVKDDRSICGSQFRENPAHLDSLKQEIANHTTGNLTFDDIYVLNHPGGRVVMFKIPPAMQGIPTAWKGHWYGRNGESLGALSLREIETMRLQSSDEHQTNSDWNQHEYASDLAIANLLGAWNELKEADLQIVCQLTNNEDYTKWIPKLREMLQQAISPITFINGRWQVMDRKGMWQALGGRVFDDTLEALKQCAVTVLSERDPQFDLSPDERYAANIYGKVPKYSNGLRKGLAETLALLGTNPDALKNFSSQHQGWKPRDTAVLAVREILENADWVLWGSLNDLLPTLAEATPNEFLYAVENALDQSPCPFDELFSQEGNLTDLLWALETLAWDAEYLVRVCVILGDLAERDPGGNWANRPANSLTTILLPWQSNTTAPINKRKVAVKTLVNENPDVAWNLLISLLPGQYQISSGTHKPEWRNNIPDDKKEPTPPKDYWKQVNAYAEMAVSMASNDIDKLAQLVGILDKSGSPSFDKLLTHLSSEDICGKPEDQRLKLWTQLTKLASNHRRFSDKEPALIDKIVSRIEDVAAKLAPENPFYLHRILFSYHAFDLYEDEESETEEKRLNQRRQQAIKEILADGGMDMVLQFSESVESPWNVGRSLGTIAQAENDNRILPALLETENTKLSLLTSAYVSCRQYLNGWEWVDGFDTSNWSVAQIGQFLSYLPLKKETWNRAKNWLGSNEKEYWSKISANQYPNDDDLGFAIDKLIAYDRPHTAIEWLYSKKPLDKSRSVKALMAAISSQEPPQEISTHNIIEIIKVLQNDPDTDPDTLFQIEWAYLNLLDEHYHRDASPKSLENRLSSDPGFFCEVIRLIYRSKKEPEHPREFSERDKAIAENAYKLLDTWKTPPGTQSDGQFLPEQFTEWLNTTKEACAKSGHLDVALMHIGKVLIHAPSDPEGLWIHRTVASALNAKDAEKLRDSFWAGICNSRGVHIIDPTGKPERELAKKYKQKAEEVENEGYQRFAVILRKLAEGYEREAEINVAEHIERESARRLAQLGGSEPQLQSVPRRRSDLE
ncbi:MAG: ATP-binding protein [Candidatus Latescibacteria bacterium]|nr:ATP-binding protein [Candidatus Latescibacterota bacterium]